jgi:opacity protein-like surface antigen
MKQVLTAAFLVLVVARGADAQTPTQPPAQTPTQPPAPATQRMYFNLNGGFQSTSGELNDATTFRLYDENASLSVAQATDSGAFVDFSAGYRVWRNATVGIGFHQGGSQSNASVEGSIPHPVFFNQNRAASLAVTDLDRSERAVHLQFGYMVPLTDRITAHFMLGPSFFKVRQDVVSAITVNETGNLTSVNAEATRTERTDTPTGFNIGVDLGYQIREVNNVKIGAGMFIRYAGASADIQVLSNTVSSDLGGLQVGLGARLRF